MNRKLGRQYAALPQFRTNIRQNQTSGKQPPIRRRFGKRIGLLA